MTAFNELTSAWKRANALEVSIRKLFEALAGELEVARLARTALDSLLAHSGDSGGAVLVVLDGERKVVAASGLRGTDVLVGLEGVHAAFGADGPVTVAVPASLELVGERRGALASQMTVLPLHGIDGALGAIVVIGDSERTVEADQLLVLFGKAVALALQNVIAHVEVQRLARTDQLTGSGNRRHGLELLEQGCMTANEARPCGVLMIDLDHFKVINDTYGHMAGDRMLAEAARAARSALRETDSLIRYGGEEFLAILPDASERSITAVAERVRASIEDMEVWADGGKMSLTASLGGTLVIRSSDMRDVLAVADDALYHAKAAGRNRAVIRCEPVLAFAARKRLRLDPSAAGAGD